MQFEGRRKIIIIIIITIQPLYLEMGGLANPPVPLYMYYVDNTQACFQVVE